MKSIKLAFFRLFIIISLALSPCSFAEKLVRLNLQEGLDAQGNQMPIDPRLSDILRMIEQESTLKFTPILLPWKRAQQETLNGNGIILGLTKTEERELIFQFSDVLGSLKVWAFTYGFGTSYILNANDLQGKKSASPEVLAMEQNLNKRKSIYSKFKMVARQLQQDFDSSLHKDVTPFFFPCAN